ncbi:MAG: phosphoadenosine phosphosulfate reductase [bacterium]
MSDTTSETVIPVDASAATDRESWLALIDQIAEEEGYLQTVGDRHWAMFVDDSPTLLVTFETIDQARTRDGQMPLAHYVAAANGWSHLCLIADGQTWFRDPAVYAYFDRLVDDSFFEDFDRVLFYGAGISAYAACALAVAAPGAQILALSPIATANPAQTSWDDRFPPARKLDFTSRYGYAPDMVEGCAAMTVITDPRVKHDAMHAALFRAPYITQLTARFAGGDLEAALIRMGILTDLIRLATDGKLTPAAYATLWRIRRHDPLYLRTLLQATDTKAHLDRAIKLCTSVNRRMKISRIQKRLAELTISQTDPERSNAT